MTGMCAQAHIRDGHLFWCIKDPGHDGDHQPSARTYRIHVEGGRRRCKAIGCPGSGGRAEALRMPGVVPAADDPAVTAFVEQVQAIIDPDPQPTRG